MAVLFYECEFMETCANCVDPDFTIFAFDTTASGFDLNEIDSFYIIRFPKSELDMPLDTTEIIVMQNPFFLSNGLFGTATLNNDYVFEGINQEFRFEITELNYSINSASDNCNCDEVENKSLRINGILIDVPDPLQPVQLRK